MKPLEGPDLSRLDDATYYARFERAREVAWPTPGASVARQPFAVIVPYRSTSLQDRTVHLARFVEEMSTRVSATGVEAWVIIVEQSDGKNQPHFKIFSIKIAPFPVRNILGAACFDFVKDRSHHQEFFIGIDQQGISEQLRIKPGFFVI